MKELIKYQNNGFFIFRPDDNLNEVCNAPNNKAGIYIITYVNKNNTEEIIYIGQSGRKDKNGNLVLRKDGIKGRIVKGKKITNQEKISGLESSLQMILILLKYIGMSLMMKLTLTAH